MLFRRIFPLSVTTCYGHLHEDDSALLNFHLEEDDSTLLNVNVQEDDSILLSVRGAGKSEHAIDGGLEEFHQEDGALLSVRGSKMHASKSGDVIHGGLAVLKDAAVGKHGLDNDALTTQLTLVENLATASVNNTISIDEDLKKTLLGLYDSIMEAINSTHADQQTELDNSEAAVAECVGAVGGNFDDVFTEVEAKNKTHSNCRTALVDLDATAETECKKLFEVESKLVDVKTDVPEVKEAQFINTLARCSTKEVEDGQDPKPIEPFESRETVATFFAKMKELEQDWQDARKACDSARDQVANYVGQCGQHQADLEHDACEYKVDCLTACHERRTACLGTAVDNWESAKDLAILNSEERKIAWVSADQIKCYIGVMLMDPDAENRKEELLKCLNKEYDLSEDTKHLTITYKSRDEVVPDPDCGCHGVLLPGSHEWSTMYQELATSTSDGGWRASCADKYQPVQQCTLADELIGLEVTSFIKTEEAKYWKLHIMRDGKGTDHVCYDLFRMVREDGSFGGPEEVIMQGHGNKYDQNRVNHVFNHNNNPGGYKKNHWCVWHDDASVTMRFANPEKFSEYIFTLHGRNCAYWPNWQILKSDDGEDWDVVTKEDDDECSNGRGHSNGEWSKFSLIRADHEGQVPSSHNWRIVWTWMRHDHVCYDLFRFRRVDGSYGAPTKVVAFNHGKRQYDSGHRDRTFNVNNVRPGLHQDHFCMWSDANNVGENAVITFEFAEKESFSHYLMTLHGENCHYWHTWEIQTSTDKETWKTVTAGTEQTCPAPLPVRNEFVMAPPVHARSCGWDSKAKHILRGEQKGCINTGRTLESAQEFCLNHPECQGFNWREDAKHHVCWFSRVDWRNQFTASGNNDAYYLPCREPVPPPPPPPGTVCGAGGIIEMGGSKWEYYPKWDCGGRDLHFENMHSKLSEHGPAWTMNKCAEQCNNRDRCTTFNWYNNGANGGCYQKHDFAKSAVLFKECGGASGTWDFYTRVPFETPATCNVLVPRKDGQPNEDGTFRTKDF